MSEPKKQPSWRIEIPGRPVPAARPRVTKRGTYIPQGVQDYAKRVRGCAHMVGVFPIKGDVKAAFTFYVPDRRRRDGDNLQKLIQDALNGLAYKDDSQIKLWTGVILQDKENPRTVVEIEGLE